MNRTVIFFCFGFLSALFSASVSAQTVSGTVNDDGLIVISGTLDLIGIDLHSPGGYLIPVSSGEADPFDVLVTNSPKEVLFGSVGVSNALSLDGELVLAAGYDGGDVFDLFGSWGGPLDGQEGSIAFTAPSVPAVPEPGAGFLATVCLLSLLSLRGRRSS